MSKPLLALWRGLHPVGIRCGICGHVGGAESGRAAVHSVAAHLGIQAECDGFAEEPPSALLLDEPTPYRDGVPIVLGQPGDRAHDSEGRPLEAIRDDARGIRWRRTNDGDDGDADDDDDSPYASDPPSVFLDRTA